jgi:hypothetical protein
MRSRGVHVDLRVPPVHAKTWAPSVSSCHSRLTFVCLLCREPGKRLKEDVPELVGAFEASQERKQKMPRSRAGQGV